MSSHDGAYRRGAHQALDFATDIADQCTTIDEVRQRLAKATEIAQRIREDQSRGYPCLLDEVRFRLHGEPDDDCLDEPRVRREMDEFEISDARRRAADF